MREVIYTDRDGRRWRRLLPDDEPDSRANIGIPAGPPPLDRLRLPLDIEIRLHNELHDRGILTRRDLTNRGEELRASIQAALRLDVQRLQEVYVIEDVLTPEVIGP